MDIKPQKTLSASDRTLRIITVFNFFPGLALLIATGVIHTRRWWRWGPDLWALIGIAPLSLSAILALAIIRFDFRQGFLVSAADALLAGWSLGMDCWGWARRDSEMLGGHAAAVLLLNFVIHSFFVLRQLHGFAVGVRYFGFFGIGGTGCTKCPHCLREARAQKTSVQAVGAKESYHRVPGRDDGYDEEQDGVADYQDARPSTDDETARLV